MMKKLSNLACFTLALCLSGAVSAAGDDLFLVSPEQGLTISEVQLLANDPDGLTIIGYQDPSRGKLSVFKNQLIYMPFDEFWAAGFDWFEYTVQGLTPQHDGPFTVFLLADDGEILFAEDFEGGFLGSDWHLVDEAGALEITPNPDKQWSLRVDLSLAGPSYAFNKKPADPRPGGKVGQGLDPGCPRMGDPAWDFVFMRGLTMEETPAFEVSLLWDDLGHRLCPRAWQDDGTVVSAPCARIPSQPIKVVLGWTRMAFSRADDGLMYLLVDGNLVALIKNLSNAQIPPVTWQFGLIETEAELSGQVWMDDLEIWLLPQR